MAMKRASTAAGILLAALFASSQATAQAPPARQDGGDTAQQTPAGTSRVTFRASTDLVALNVTVTDGNGRYVSGLSRKDFAVFDDGVPQDISFFATSLLPVDLAIMIDTSSSMRDKMSFVQKAAIQFVRTLRPGDRAEVLAFSDNTQTLAPFTSDRTRLEAAIMNALPYGGTALYNAIYIAIGDLSRLAKQQQDGVRRQAIVVLTDGDDTASTLRYEDVDNAARRSPVAIYPIAVISDFEAQKLGFNNRDRFFGEAEFALKRLAQDTGARSFFPLSLSDLNGVYGSIAEELSTQYSLGYIPKSKADGSFHRLLVRVPNHPRAEPRTRAGYYAERHLDARLFER
jgi:Ca-activated chloride channel family protein